jgi:hypothetical protein
MNGTAHADVRALPGTVHLLDLDHTVHARHQGTGEIILHPAPSEDAEDPLNWSPRRKTMAIICFSLLGHHFVLKKGWH